MILLGEVAMAVKMPTWLKVLLPILVVVALLVATVTRVLMDEVPAHARPAVLEERFAEQLAFLRGMADSLPMNVCTDDLLSSLELDESADPDVIREQLESILAPMEQWQAQATAGWSALDDPVILSADIVQFCNDSGSTFIIKPYEATSIAWSSSARCAFTFVGTPHRSERERSGRERATAIEYLRRGGPRFGTRF